MTNLKQNIRQVRQAIVAIGFHPAPDKITILGSGFISGGKIISAAHLLNGLTQEQIAGLKANVMVAQQGDIENYHWLSIKLDKHEPKDDLAVFTAEYDLNQLPNLKLGDSESVEIGQDVYFIGFPYAAQLINDGFGITLVANKGMVSNIKRDGADPNHKRNWFIIDAISNPGNSGCPVINAETNEVIGVMSISFRTKSQVKGFEELEIREPMHIAGAKPINLVKELLK